MTSFLPWCFTLSILITSLSVTWPATTRSLLSRWKWGVFLPWCFTFSILITSLSVTWPATTRSLLSRWKWRVFYLDASRLVSWSLACQLPGQLLRGRWSTGENDEFLSGVHSQSTEGFKLWPHPLVMNMYVVRIVCTQPGYWGLWTVATPTSHEYVRHTNCVYTVRLLGELNCGHAHWLWICMSCVYTAGLLGELNCGHAHWLWICMSCVYTAGLLCSRRPTGSGFTGRPAAGTLSHIASIWSCSTICQVIVNW